MHVSVESDNVIDKNIVHILILLQGLCLKDWVLLNSGLYMDDIAV